MELRVGKNYVTAGGYVVVLSVLSGVGYTTHNPQGVLKFVKSCIPVVNIDFNK